MMKKTFKKTSAYSLVFAFVFMTGIMLVAASSIQDTQNKVRFFNDLEASSKARLAAESAVDKALRDLRGFEAGYESADANAFCEVDPLDSGSCKTSGEYQILAQGNNVNAGARSFVPIPGTGSAAPDDACDVMADPQEGINHSCNWNKMLVGETVNIPLYSVDSSTGDFVLPTLDAAWTDWKLKVRTPCSNGSLLNGCDGGVRYVLDGDSVDYANDDTVILWQLTAQVDDGTPEGQLITVVPNDQTVSVFDVVVGREFSLNTEIYESLINDPSINTDLTGYIVLKGQNINEYTPLYELSTGMESAIGTGNTLEQLVLQLNIVSPLIEQGTGSSVPYLEWQLSNSGPGHFADNKTVIVGEGTYQGVNGTYYFPYNLEVDTIDESAIIYTLGN